MSLIITSTHLSLLPAVQTNISNYRVVLLVNKNGVEKIQLLIVIRFEAILVFRKLYICSDRNKKIQNGNDGPLYIEKAKKLIIMFGISEFLLYLPPSK